MASRVYMLELCNFKSYVGKIAIGPFHSFSCIVGPNGAGKSNIMDALSFVLGDQNALRGQRLEEMINKRAASNAECSVKLFLRTPSGGEVTLKKAIRSGEGRARLFVDDKQVSEKEFLATLKRNKIGARTNTFLVFQHAVEEVAQMRARELTELLEQVSGSIDFKDEYNQKKKLMELANEQLAAASVEKRGAAAEVQQMRLHKKEAEKFEKLREALALERRDFALSELFHIESRLNKYKRELVAHSAEVSSLTAGITTDEDLRKLKKEYAERHKAYLELLKKGREVGGDFREKKGTLERIKASIIFYQNRLRREREELKNSKEAAAVFSKESKRLEEQLKNQESLLESFEKQCEVEDRDAAKHAKMSPENLAEYKTLRKEADCQTISLRQELEMVRRQRDSLLEGLKQASLAAENHEVVKKETKAVMDRATERVRELRAQMGEMADSEKELDLKLRNIRSSLRQTQQRRQEQQEELTRMNAQLHDLRFVRDDHSHAEKAMETLESLKSLRSGVRGRLVDLCTISNPRYRNAVTVAMGRNLDAVVVDTTEVALACVRYLKDQRLPTMTFIPLNSAQGSAVNDQLRTFGGTCRPVVDCIKYDPSLESAVRFAVGQTLVCDSIAEARRVAYEHADGSRYKVVTLDGTLLLKNGSMQGGLATVQARARKWDERQYDTLKQARDKLMHEIAAISDADETRDLCDAQELQAKIDFNANRSMQMEKEIAALEARSNSLSADQKRQAAQAQKLTQRKEEYEKKREDLESKMLELQKEITKIDKKVFAAFHQRVGIPDIAEYESKQLQRAKQRADTRQQMTLVIHKIKTALENEQKKSGARQTGEIEKAVAKTEAELATSEKDVVIYQKVVNTVMQKHNDTQAQCQQLKTELESIQERIRKQGRSSEAELQKLVHARKAVTMLESACEALRQQRLSLFQRCRMDEIDLPTAPPDAPGKKRGRGETGSSRDTEEAQLLDISEAFSSFSEGDAAAAKGQRKAAVTLCIDFSKMPEQVRRLAVDKATFAPFKTKAEATIDQYERELEAIAPNLKASMRFDTSERKLGLTVTNLDEAREKSRQALAEFSRVKEIRAARFMDAYDRILENVDRVYKELTASTRANGVEGTAYLTLEDAEEPFNSGTKYHATPPMKRFMTMEHLSGGERTMAALALMFAIHSVSPTPFFVLDEVDAALDVGNVQKLSQFLKAHSNECQYIVVSLKEHLYHMADTLIGVYKDQQHRSSGTLTVDLRSCPA